MGYDVFFSFRIKCFFKSSLESSLRANNIKTFIDDKYDKGKIPPSVLRAIEASRISVVVFTEEFGDSRRNLQKLEMMMKMHRKKGQVVLPMYYGVKVWEVRKQSGKFGEAFEGLMKGMCVMEDQVLRWRRELAQVTCLPGWNVSFSSQGKTIIHIIDTIKRILDDTSLFIAHHPVGIDLHVAEVLQLCDLADKKVRIIGICGPGGFGKTTIAKTIYNEIGDKFQKRSFLANIKYLWDSNDGKIHLQEQLISNICYAKDGQIHDSEMGDGQMKILQRNSKVLLVLDDVSKIDQLRSFCGDREWFGEGSIVLVTTGDKYLLGQFEVDYVYNMKKMDKSKSLELFSWHAFKCSCPPNDFIDLSRKAITFCGGVPLALEVLGSLFLDKTIIEGKSLLGKLSRYKNNVIPQVLKVSYGCLENEEKDIFHEIASFHLGKDRQYVTETLNDCGFSAEADISELIMRSLLKVDKNNKLEMHDYLQEMGRGDNPSKKTPNYMYDVFLSFRGEETRTSFTSHLCAALKNAGIEIFMDDRLKRGENISSSLVQAIECSRILMIIFSTTYAGSTWCLQELEKIMECRRYTNQEVLPIFYGVQASEVRKQVGSFGKAFEELVTRISTGKGNIWRRALTEAANISGWDLRNYKTEANLITQIVESVTMKLDDNTNLFVANHPVGVKSRVQEIVKLLSVKSNEVIILGIWGMGGIGKTTIAKAVYNEIGRNFEVKSFLERIREHWDQGNGEVNLQQQLLSDVLKERKRKLQSHGIVKTVMKERLPHKRALVVFDDVDKREQLSALCESRDWFGQGSRIIITTRDEHLLNVLQVDSLCNMKELDGHESLELFSWHAFKQANPIGDFIELSRRVVNYSGGLPLALEVLGSYLFDRPVPAWESVLEKLQRIPNDQIHKKLKISYDGLSDQMEKDVFLDICCFFIGKDRSYVTQILNGCGLHAEIGITRLIELNLVKVDKNNKFIMHDLVRDMGREIIREKSPDEPEKRNRLWAHDDVLDVLINNTGTMTVKGLALNLSRTDALSLSTKAFKKMKKLKLLQLSHVELVGDFDYLSKDLRWLCWHGFSSRHMPENFYQKNLVAIDLKYSNLTQVWKESQLLERLKILNLSHSHYLIKTPDFSKLPNLEKLILKDCPCLYVVHSTIGDLKHLVLLNLKNCKELNHLPRTIYNLKSLKTLNLSGCSKISKLEEDIEQMESLTTLVADNTAITQVPFSLGRSKSIKYVSLCGYKGLSRKVFPSLIWSWMSPTNYPKSLVQPFASMPVLLRNLLRDGSHAISHKELKAVPSTSTNLNTILEATLGTSQIACTKALALIGFHDLVVHIAGSPEMGAKFTVSPSTSQISCTEALGLISLRELVHLRGPKNFMSSLIIQVGDSNTVVNNILLESILQGWNDGEFDDSSLPKDNYPIWLTFKGENSSVVFKVPQGISSNIKGMIFCVVYSSTLDLLTSVYPFIVLIKNCTKATIDIYKRDTEIPPDDEEWQAILSNLEPCHEVEITVAFGRKFNVKKTIVYLVYSED